MVLPLEIDFVLAACGNPGGMPPYMAMRGSRKFCQKGLTLTFFVCLFFVLFFVFFVFS